MIEISDEQELFPEFASQLEEKLHEIAKQIHVETIGTSLLLCDDESIAEINKEWREKDEATDVLSFCHHEETFLDFKFPKRSQKELPFFLGDIIISVETCARQAQEMEHTLLEEACRLWVHGFLHLCGYDHIDSEDAIEMQSKEKEVLAILFPQVLPLVVL